MAELIVKKGKKKFYPIIAPTLFNEQLIGEIPLYDLRDSIGRTLRLNLMVLTNDPKKQNINIHFEITGVDGQKARAEVIKYNILPASIKRMMRRKKIRIDDSFVVKTKDNKLIRIKTFFITAGFAKGSATRELHKKNREILTKDIAKMDYDDFLRELISHKLQSDLREKLKKIYPLSICEIKVMEVEKEKKEEEKEKKKKRKEKKEEKEEKEEEIKEEVKEKEEKAVSNEK